MNKQQLSEALAEFDNHIFDFGKLESLAAAARLVERLLPGECENCESKGHVLSISMDRVNAGIGPPRPVYMTCPVCHGSGQVWDEGIVEAVAKALPDSEHFSTDEDYHQAARIVLSALVELLTEKVP